jgi:hypothetical protein
VWQIQVLLFWNFLEFFPNIFNLMSVESMNEEAVDMEYQLYSCLSALEQKLPAEAPGHTGLAL